MRIMKTLQRDEHTYLGRRSGRDISRTVRCAFCDATFKAPEDAAAHERTRHRKALRRLKAEAEAKAQTEKVR